MPLPIRVVGLVIVAACGGNPGPTSTSVRIPELSAVVVEAPPPEPSDPCGSPGVWTTLASVELPGRIDHTAVWTGDQMIVWGGTRSPQGPLSDGARYEPAMDAWHPTSLRQAPLQRDDHAAVWTGTEMIIWGGNHGDEKLDKLATGGRYDPVRDTWRPTPESGLTPRDDPRAVWTGSEMIVWGGRDQAGHSATGARFSPAKDRWRRVASRGAPEPREDHTAIWTGTEMIVWGGWTGSDNARDYAIHGGRYDPATDRWRPISDVGAPDPREDHTAIWTGSEMIVWGGAVREGRAQTPRQLATGARYAPETDTWTPITLADAPSAREDDVVAWTGTEMVVWGGQRDDQPLQTGARYVPARDSWCTLASVNAPDARRDHAGVWTGTELVLWGGKDPDDTYPSTGASWTP